MKALEVMQRQVVTVTAEASIDEAVRLSERERAALAFTECVTHE